MAKETTHQLIMKSLNEKASMKQDVNEMTRDTFSILKRVASQITTVINKDKSFTDKRIVVEFKDRGEFEFELRIAGELLIFSMHTNVFDFDKSHTIWKSSYIKDGSFRSFCGLISIYNFLNDSIKYNRMTDLGYLIGRMFVNREKHYFLEGKRQLGFLYNDFVHDVIDEKSMKSVVESTILYCLSFDLYTPPFDAIKEITVSEMMLASENMPVRTGKRLGFKFEADNDEIS